MLQVDSLTFKGKLLDLLGRCKTEVLSGNPRPDVRVEGDQAERLMWADHATHEETNRRFRIWYMVRLFGGNVWAVGIWAEDFMVTIDSQAEGQPSLVAVPKDPALHDREMVNWIGKRDDTYYEIGASY